MCLQRLKEAQENLPLSNAPDQGRKKASTPIDDQATIMQEISNQIEKNHTFVRRLRSEADQPFNFVPKVQGGGVDGRAYLKIIEEALPSFIENGFASSNKNWMFMHGNAPPHRSKYTMKWLQDKGIKVMKWPAISPRS
ncbi:unnamed protein product [Rotaria socialis]|uniref:Transposase n=1 Tax=Rotaria socialis TaxID=392032 RepID=A0A818UGW7_9BILA|nr:unnamed protein product [Rotaria socialis]